MSGIPKQIKDNLFTVGERIGKGAFGDVYKAKMKDGKDVAIKFEDRHGNNRCLQNEVSVILCHFIAVHHTSLIFFLHFLFEMCSI